MSFCARKPGISLVVVLITIALVTAVLLTGAAALLSVSRQRAAIQSAGVAELQAQAALEEARARLNDPALLVDGEYGVKSGSALLVSEARHRGYRSDSSCQRYVADGSTSQTSQLPSFDPNCPSYQLSIRRFVEPPISGGGRSYTYKPEDFHNGQLDIIVRTPASQGVQLTGTSSPIANMTYQFCTSETDDNSCQAPQQSSSFTAIDAGLTIRRIRLSNVPLGTGLTVQHSNNTNPFVVSKGFTTAEAVGVAPDGSTRRYLIVRRPSGTVTKPLSGTFTAAGLCEPDNDACR